MSPLTKEELSLVISVLYTVCSQLYFLIAKLYNCFLTYSVRLKKGVFMGKLSSTHRVIEILKLLNDGKVLCVDNLGNVYDTSTRSIRRDFEMIREIFGDILISHQKGCYQTVNKLLLEDTLNSTELYMLKNILKLSEKSNLSLSKNVDASIKAAIIKEDKNSPYLFKNKPYEEI
jgi:hypothetical protein